MNALVKGEEKGNGGRGQTLGRRGTSWAWRGGVVVVDSYLTGYEYESLRTPGLGSAVNRGVESAALMTWEFTPHSPHPCF